MSKDVYAIKCAFDARQTRYGLSLVKTEKLTRRSYVALFRVLRYNNFGYLANGWLIVKNSKDVEADFERAKKAFLERYKVINVYDCYSNVLYVGISQRLIAAKLGISHAVISRCLLNNHYSSFSFNIFYPGDEDESILNIEKSISLKTKRVYILDKE